ncbi:MAG: hypothetical protein GC151_18610 [Betaproteobacteria bacterium]|nr:hypothetical protein [Betaproteobacteria bacterium]
METSQLKKMKRHRKLYRFMGFIWALIGTMLLFAIMPLIFDPNGTKIFNGVLTTALGPKVYAALLAAVFVVAGLGVPFVPNRFLDRFFVWRQSLWSSIAFWR